MNENDLFYNLEVIEDDTINDKYFFVEMTNINSNDVVSKDIKNMYLDYDTAYSNLKKDTEYVGIFKFKDKEIYIIVDFNFLKK